MSDFDTWIVDIVGHGNADMENETKNTIVVHAYYVIHAQPFSN